GQKRTSKLQDPSTLSPDPTDAAPFVAIQYGLRESVRRLAPLMANTRRRYARKLYTELLRCWKMSTTTDMDDEAYQAIGVELPFVRCQNPLWLLNKHLYIV